MKRPLDAEELRLWALVARTVKPAPGRLVPRHDPPKAPAAAPRTAAAAALPIPPPRPLRPSPAGLQDIEPNRKRRLARGIAPIDAVLDLHGHDQDRGKAALFAFLVRAFEDGHRAALVITGRGAFGDGVLRRRLPEWLAEPQLRPVVAGFSPAHRRHGGEGAFYVALKRRPG